MKAVEVVVALMIAARRKRLHNLRTAVVKDTQVRSLLSKVAKAAQVNSLRKQSAGVTTDLLKSPTQTILIPVISSIRSQDEQ
jgi:hypothetical protein